MSLSNVFVPGNFNDVSTMHFPLSPMIVPSSAHRITDSRDSGVSSTDSLASLLNYFAPVTGPVRKEWKKRIKEDYCKLCRKQICAGDKRSQGPARHIQQYHMKKARFLCPHCSYTSDYDKGHVTTHINRMHQGLAGEIRETTDPAYAEKFNELRDLCFGVSDQKPKDEVKPNCSGSPSRLPFSIESILASTSSKEQVSPPAPLMFFPFQW